MGIDAGVRLAHRHPAGDLRSCELAVLPICHMRWLDGVYEEHIEQEKRGQSEVLRGRTLLPSWISSEKFTLTPFPTVGPCRRKIGETPRLQP